MGGTSMSKLTNMLKKPTEAKELRHALRARCKSVASCCLAIKGITVGEELPQGLESTRGRIPENPAATPWSGRQIAHPSNRWRTDPPHHRYQGAEEDLKSVDRYLEVDLAVFLGRRHVAGAHVDLHRRE